MGDTFIDEGGQPHIITNVLICHYLREGMFKVLYEVDWCGEFQELQMVEEGDISELAPTAKEYRPPLKIVPKSEK